MYPTISDLIQDLFGIYIPLPIQSFGFFVAIAFIIASYFLGREMKRKEGEGYLQASTKKVVKGKKATFTDYLSSGIIGFIIGFKLIYAIFNYDEFVNNPQATVLSAKGSMLGGLLIASISIFIKYREKEKERKEYEKETTVEETVHPHQHVGNMTLLAAVFGLLGAKIFHLLENPDEFGQMFESLTSFFSGLTMYGGLILGTIAVIYYAKKHELKAFSVMDAAAPALMLAYGIGRIGCQVAGDGDWGITNHLPQPEWLSFLPDWMWAFRYPHNVINAGIPIEGCQGDHCFQLANPVWPTPFYESVMAIGIFLILWGVRKKISTPGVMFSVYLIFNGIERFFIEKIRVNEVTNFLGMEVTQAEIISTFLFLLGIFGVYYLRKNKKLARKF